MINFTKDGIKVTQTSVRGLSLDSVGVATNDFLSKEVLAKCASDILQTEEYKDFIIFYDGCMTYNIKIK